MKLVYISISAAPESAMTEIPEALEWLFPACVMSSFIGPASPVFEAGAESDPAEAGGTDSTVAGGFPPDEAAGSACVALCPCRNCCPSSAFGLIAQTYST